MRSVNDCSEKSGRAMSRRRNPVRKDYSVEQDLEESRPSAARGGLKRHLDAVLQERTRFEGVHGVDTLQRCSGWSARVQRSSLFDCSHLKYGLRSTEPASVTAVLYPPTQAGTFFVPVSFATTMYSTLSTFQFTQQTGSFFSHHFKVLMFGGFETITIIVYNSFDLFSTILKMPSSVETQTATVQSWQLGTPVLANQLRGSSVSLVALVKETTVQEVQSDTSSTSTNTASSGASPDSDQEHAGVVAADKELEAQASTLVRSSPPQPQPQLEEQQQQAQDQELEQPPAAPANERGTSKTSDAVGGSAPQTTTTPGASAIKAAADTERTTTSGKGKDKTRGKRDRGGKDTNNIQGRGAEDGTASGPRKGPLTRMLRKVRLEPMHHSSRRSPCHGPFSTNLQLHPNLF